MSSTVEIKTTYTDRLCSQFVNDEASVYNGSQVCEMIRDYSAQEFERKKLDTNKISFGKFKGRTIKEVLAFDRQYLTWLIKQPMMDEKFAGLKKSIVKALE
jgi:uncharacterized protein (DUF3820 family)